MNVQQLLDILNNRKEIPRPECAEVFFYSLDENGKEVEIELKSVGAFSISTDITFSFEKVNNKTDIKDIKKEESEYWKTMIQEGW